MCLRVVLCVASCARAFHPLTDARFDASHLRKGEDHCERSRQAVVRFDANAEPYDGGRGGLGLGGGIEVAVDAKFCPRMLHRRGRAAAAGAECDRLLAALRRGCEFWSSRHPTVYFNWTSPLHDTKRAELVFTSSWDDPAFGKGRSDTIACAPRAPPLRAAARAPRARLSRRALSRMVS